MKIFVYTKSEWAGDWGAADQRLTCLRVTEALPPGIGTASFTASYGKGYYEDNTDITDGASTVSYINKYVKVAIADDDIEANAVIQFIGRFLPETFDLLGKYENASEDVVVTAGQEILAYDMSAMLTTGINGAWVLSGSQGKYIERSLSFNVSNSAGELFGNRSTNDITVSSTAIKLISTDGKLWNAWDLLKHIITLYQPQSGPVYMLRDDATTASVKEALLSYESLWNLSGLNLRDAIIRILQRKRGWIWYVDATGANPEIVINTVIGSAISIDSITIPANYNQQAVDLWAYGDDISVKVTDDNRQKYDRIEVWGEPVKSCFTVSVNDGTLEKGWGDDIETQYKAAKSTVTGYSSWTAARKAAENDRYRAEEKFNTVYTTFKIPDSFNWEIDSWKANPVVDDSGVVLTLAANYHNADRVLYPQLPLRQGWDYTTDPPTPPTVSVEANDEYMPVLVWGITPAGNMVRLDKSTPAAARVRPLKTGMGIEVKFNPQYILAGTVFSDAEPGLYDDLNFYESDGESNNYYWYDYQTLYATVFAETDQRLKVAADINTTGELLNTLVIHEPGAELWLIDPNAIIGLDADGNDVNSAVSILRNDVNRLQAVLAGAIAWYGSERNRLSLTTGGIVKAAPIGSYLTDTVNVGNMTTLGTVVSSITLNFNAKKPTSILLTDFTELDFSSSKYRKAKIGSFSAKPSYNKSAPPGQISPPAIGGSGDATQWAIVTTMPEYEESTGDRYTVQKASVDESGNWVGDGTDITIERAIGYEGYDSEAIDIRNWVPWFKVGAIVRIVSRWDEAEADTIWYLDEPLIYTGGETTSGLRYSEELGHPVPVWI